jgi:rare lipoprotein A
MNKKLLISALIMLTSGCATQTTSSLKAGTGGGAAGVGQAANSKPAFVAPIIPTPSAAANIKNDTAALNVPKLTKPVYLQEHDLASVKSREPETIYSKPKTENLTTPYLNRYSNNKNKSISSGAPASSAGNPSSYAVSGENYKVLPFSNGFVERGIASWYGPDFHGEKTSNGEIYDMYGMTAAHKNLPIPSYVRVTNLKNKRSVVLRINDRGPFYADRVIDLSYAAAQKLDIHKPGTEMVQIEAIKTSGKEQVFLQLGVFSNPTNAQMLQKKVIENKMPAPMVKEVRVDGKLAYRVQLGPIFSTDKVNEFNTKLTKMGISETWYITENKLN